MYLLFCYFVLQSTLHDKEEFAEWLQAQGIKDDAVAILKGQYYTAKFHTNWKNSKWKFCASCEMFHSTRVLSLTLVMRFVSRVERKVGNRVYSESSYLLTLQQS